MKNTTIEWDIGEKGNKKIKLETIQIKSLRIITGPVKTTSIVAIQSFTSLM